MYLSTISTTSTNYTSIDTRLTTPDFWTNCLAQKPPKRHKSPPMATIDLWMNQCLTCGTNNPSPAKQKPSMCSGCGQQLVTATATWAELNEREIVFYRAEKAALDKWKASAGR